MKFDSMGTMRAIVRVYSWLHPARNDWRTSHAVWWEMDHETVDMLKREVRRMSPLGVVLEFDIPGFTELQCLGVKVVEVERPGVRLVIEAVPE